MQWQFYNTPTHTHSQHSRIQIYNTLAHMLIYDTLTLTDSQTQRFRAYIITTHSRISNLQHTSHIQIHDKFSHIHIYDTLTHIHIYDTRTYRFIHTYRFTTNTRIQIHNIQFHNTFRLTTYISHKQLHNILAYMHCTDRPGQTKYRSSERNLLNHTLINQPFSPACF